MQSKFILIDQYVFISLLLKLGIIGALASLLMQFEQFKQVFFAEKLELKNRLSIILLMGLIIGFGSILRLRFNYAAADLTLEGSLLAGIVGGPLAGMGVGLIASLPAFISGEYLCLFYCLLAGFAAGQLVNILQVKAERYDFSPFSLIKIRPIILSVWQKKRISWKLALLLLALSFEGGRLLIFNHFSKHYLFAISGRHFISDFFSLITIVGSLGVALKVWNNSLVEIQLYQSQQSLLRAKLATLQARMQPHFLFNTLNTIASLIRSDREKARKTLHLLSHILRGHLENQEDFRPLQKEFELLQAYLEIEKTRFGSEQLRSSLNIPEDFKHFLLPTMMIQPIVENSIKHGIAPKVGGGEVKIDVFADKRFLNIKIKDNGVGIAPQMIEQVKTKGEGISNLLDRLTVLYGKGHFLFEIVSSVSEGTEITIGIPIESIANGEQ